MGDTPQTVMTTGTPALSKRCRQYCAINSLYTVFINYTDQTVHSVCADYTVLLTALFILFKLPQTVMASRTPAVLTNNQNNEQINFLANPFVQCGFLLVFPIFRTKKEDELQPTRSGVTQTQTQMCHNKSCKWRRIGSSLFTRKSCKLKKYFVPLDKSFILQFGEIGMRHLMDGPHLLHLHTPIDDCK